MRPPHLPRVSSTVSTTLAPVSVTTVESSVSSGLKAVKVIGSAAVPSAISLPPCSTTSAGASEAGLPTGMA